MNKPRRHGLPVQKPMTVAGIMSGTSGDGIDVAFVRISPGPSGLKLKFLAQHAVAFPKALRTAVLNAMDARSISSAELGRLNWRLGIAYSEAYRQALQRHPIRIDLVGCHGQTIYHQGVPALYTGRKLACTWQLGEMAMLATEAGVPVVSNFRPADMVAGGQGAPLVSLLDFVFFRHPVRGRVLQNLGGIGNLTAIPPGASMADVVAFDTGPANMVLDTLMQELFSKSYDRGGATAARGQILPSVVAAAMQHPFFRARPPKSAGREEFGARFAAQFIRQCQDASQRSEDAIATAAALTAESIRAAYEKFVQPLMGDADVDYLVSGGGARNPTLTVMLQQALAPYRCKVATTEGAGLPAQAKEGAAFALMAYETWHWRTGNVPAATGARHAAILGQVTYV